MIKYSQVNDMEFTLRPYSTMIFWIMAVITVCMIVYAIIHLRALSTTLTQVSHRAEEIEKNVELLNIKTEVLAEHKAEKDKKNRYAKLIVPGLLAIKAVYDAHDNYHGISGYTKAANDVLFGSKVDAFNKEKKKLR